ncbi:MAG TPA: hypothetical protein VF792_08605 [Ktedonobacterales bacterium]
MNAQMPHTGAEMRRELPSGARAFTLLLAAGVYVILSGIVFLSPLVLNSTAKQNDVYMSNYFIAPLIIILGVICLLLGSIGLWRAVSSGRAWGIGRRSVIIAALGAVVMLALYLAFGGHYSNAYGVISWPPYMNGASLVIMLVVGVLVLVAIRFWTPTLSEKRKV